ncbi:GAF domain-containing protein [Paenibacillus sambharensis]|nr:GAF domain-containing protein [Paenibacillus sambharensis]
MDEVTRKVIDRILDELRNTASSDLAALAWKDEEGRRIRWIAASGNRNERFRRMALKPGKGITGEVLRAGRMVVIAQAAGDTESTACDHPIMLAEQLQSAVAIPVLIDHKAYGVLLLGNRSSPLDADALLSAAGSVTEQLSRLFKPAG